MISMSNSFCPPFCLPSLLPSSFFSLIKNSKQPRLSDDFPLILRLQSVLTLIFSHVSSIKKRELLFGSYIENKQGENNKTPQLIEQSSFYWAFWRINAFKSFTRWFFYLCKFPAVTLIILWTYFQMSKRRYKIAKREKSHAQDILSSKIFWKKIMRGVIRFLYHSFFIEASNYLRQNVVRYYLRARHHRLRIFRS